MKVLTSYFGFPFLSHGSFCDSFNILIRIFQDRVVFDVYLTDTVASCKDKSFVYQRASTQSLDWVYPNSRHPGLYSQFETKTKIWAEATLEFLAL